MVKVSCGILRDGNKFFVARRPADKQMGGYWEFPGGKVEEDEFESDCLHREWEEELGAKVIITKEYMPVSYDYSKFQIQLFPFEVSLLDGEITLKEHSESGFFSKEELLKMNVTPADRLVIEKHL